MSKSRLSYIVLLVVLVSVRVSFGGSIVDPKIILEIQPSYFELGDYFTDAANQAMIDSGYIYLQSFEAEFVGDQNVKMEIIKGGLRSSTDYGILEYGGHGGDFGETGGETFASRAEADAKMQYLIDWRYFTAEELVIERNKVQHYTMSAFRIWSTYWEARSRKEKYSFSKQVGLETIQNCISRTESR